MKEIEENGEIMVFNDTFSNISAISCMCLSILLEDETGVPEETHDLHEVIDKLFSATLVVIGTHCIDREIDD
jgi:hypothetical protein